MSEPKTWAEIRAVVLYRDDYECQICGEEEATEADHIWPRSAGGPDDLWNLQAACKPCNQSKGSKFDVFEATLLQLTWLQTHLNKVVQKAQNDADNNRAWFQTWGAAMAAAVHDVTLLQVNERSDWDELISRTFALLTRKNWVGGSLAYIAPRRIADASADLRAAAEKEYRARLAECDAADQLVLKMIEVKAGDLEDYARFEQGLRGVWRLMGSFASGEVDL